MFRNIICLFFLVFFISFQLKAQVFNGDIVRSENANVNGSDTLYFFTAEKGTGVNAGRQIWKKLKYDSLKYHLSPFVRKINVSLPQTGNTNYKNCFVAESGSQEINAYVDKNGVKYLFSNGGIGVTDSFLNVRSLTTANIGGGGDYTSKNISTFINPFVLSDGWHILEFRLTDFTTTTYNINASVSITGLPDAVWDITTNSYVTGFTSRVTKDGDRIALRILGGTIVAWYGNTQDNYVRYWLQNEMTVRASQINNLTIAVAAAEEITTYTGNGAPTFTPASNAPRLAIGSLAPFPLFKWNGTIWVEVGGGFSNPTLNYYISDKDAEDNGITIGGEYLLDSGNLFGLPKGFKKKREY